MDMLTCMFPLETETGAMEVPLKLPDKDGPTDGTTGCLKFPGLAAAPAAMVGLTFMETVANKDC